MATKLSTTVRTGAMDYDGLLSIDNNEMASFATWSIDNEMDDTDCTPIGNSTWTGTMENDISCRNYLHEFLM